MISAAYILFLVVSTGLASDSEVPAKRSCSSVIIRELSKVLVSKSSRSPGLTIANLGFNEEIPTKTFKALSTEEIARRVVQWVRHSEEKFPTPNPRDEAAFLDPMQDAHIFLHFKAKHIPGITQRGYRNFHETGHTNGNPVDRAREEDALLGLKIGIGHKQRELRPKSAVIYITHIDNQVYIGGQKEHQIRKQYGHLAAVMKKEVKERTLWVLGDSHLITPSFVSARENKGHIVTEEVLNRIRGTFYRKWVSTHVPGVEESHHFFEGLIYGKINFYRDVDHFVVYWPWLAQPLKVFGKPIFLVDGQGKWIKYLRLLSKGDSKAPPEEVPREQFEKFRNFWSER